MSGLGNPAPALPHAELMALRALCIASCIVLPGCGADEEEPVEFRHCEGDTEAHRNFDAFWSYFDREYALFDLRLPAEDWNALGEAACAAIHPDMTDRELFDLMVATAEHLDDGHVY